MKVIVSSTGPEMGSEVSRVFGRAEYYLLVDTGDMSAQPLKNPATGQSSGAGIRAAQFVLEQKPEALISSNVGPNAFEVLSAGGVECYSAPPGSVKSAVEAFEKGTLESLSSANAGSHSGITGAGVSDGPADSSGEEQLEMLAKRLRELRGQVADIIDKIDQLTKE